MTTPDTMPCGATHFDVRFSGQGEPVLGFCEVLFDPFVNTALSSSPEAQVPEAAPQRLVLRRGFDGSLALYRWWDQSRKHRLQRGRTVTVHLLDSGHHSPVVSWVFSHAQPVLLAYSPLDALHGGLLMETLTLRYDTVTMKQPPQPAPKETGRRVTAR